MPLTRSQAALASATSPANNSDAANNGGEGTSGSDGVDHSDTQDAGSAPDTQVNTDPLAGFEDRLTDRDDEERVVPAHGGLVAFSALDDQSRYEKFRYRDIRHDEGTIIGTSAERKDGVRKTFDELKKQQAKQIEKWGNLKPGQPPLRHLCYKSDCAYSANDARESIRHFKQSKPPVHKGETIEKHLCFSVAHVDWLEDKGLVCTKMATSTRKWYEEFVNQGFGINRLAAGEARQAAARQAAEAGRAAASGDAEQGGDDMDVGGGEGPVVAEAGGNAEEAGNTMDVDGGEESAATEA